MILPDTFVRITRGRFEGMSGTVVDTKPGYALLVMTSTCERRWVRETMLRAKAGRQTTWRASDVEEEAAA